MYHCGVGLTYVGTTSCQPALCKCAVLVRLSPFRLVGVTFGGPAPEDLCRENILKQITNVLINRYHCYVSFSIELFKVSHTKILLPTLSTIMAVF